MILATYTFDGDPVSLMEGHRRLMEMFTPAGFDLHIAVTHEHGLTVFDSCPDRPTHDAFVSSPEFRGALSSVGLPDPEIAVLGEVHFAHMNQTVLR